MWWLKNFFCRLYYFVCVNCFSTAHFVVVMQFRSWTKQFVSVTYKVVMIFIDVISYEIFLFSKWFRYALKFIAFARVNKLVVMYLGKHVQKRCHFHLRCDNNVYFNLIEMSSNSIEYIPIHNLDLEAFLSEDSIIPKCLLANFMLKMMWSLLQLMQSLSRRFTIIWVKIWTNSE